MMTGLWYGLELIRTLLNYFGKSTTLCPTAVLACFGRKAGLMGINRAEMEMNDDIPCMIGYIDILKIHSWDCMSLYKRYNAASGGEFSSCSSLTSSFSFFSTLANPSELSESVAAGRWRILYRTSGIRNLSLCLYHRRCDRFVRDLDRGFRGNRSRRLVWIDDFLKDSTYEYWLILFPMDQDPDGTNWAWYQSNLVKLHFLWTCRCLSSDWLQCLNGT